MIANSGKIDIKTLLAVEDYTASKLLECLNTSQNYDCSLPNFSKKIVKDIFYLSDLYVVSKYLNYGLYIVGMPAIQPDYKKTLLDATALQPKVYYNDVLSLLATSGLALEWIKQD